MYEQHLADVRRLIFDHLDEDQTAALGDAMTVIASGLTNHHQFLSGSRST